MSADNIQFLLSRSNDYAILPTWGSWAVVMSSRERAMTVGTFGLVGAVDSSRSNMKIEVSAAVVAALVPSALCWVAEALTARVMSRDRRLLVD